MKGELIKTLRCAQNDGRAKCHPEVLQGVQLPPEAISEQIFLPERSRVEWGITLLLFVTSCLYFLIFYNFSKVNWDEGIILFGAERILAGQVLYRDFFSFYTPGSYYLLALLFKLFGSSILVGRAALVVYGGLFTALLYVLARRVCSRGSALFAAYLLTITCVPYRFLVLHNWDSTLWACLALYCAIWVAYRPRAIWALGMGGFAALTCLFEQSKGAGLVAGLAAGYLVLMLNADMRPIWNRRRLLVLVAGFGAPFLVAVAYFGFHHGLRELFTDWFWPLGHYSGVNRVPFGYLVLSTSDRSSLWQGPWSWRLVISLVTSSCLLFPLLPLAALGILAHWALRVRRRGWTGERAAYYVLCSSSIGGLLLGVFVTGRPDFTHLLYHGPLFFLPLAWIVEGRDIRSRLLSSLKPLLVLVCLLAFTALGISSLVQPLNAHATLATRRGTLKAPAPDAVLDYVQRHVAPGEPIFVYPYTPLYYYLTATRNPTPYEFLQPGMHAPQQYAEALHLITSHPPLAVLFDPSFEETIAAVFPALTPQVFAARDSLQEYILTQYHPCAVLPSSVSWPFVFMVRNGSACPGAVDGLASWSTATPAPQRSRSARKLKARSRKSEYERYG
jgi:4-amino-4-deoxy-L-arabinose transferase-like glycosyltransferase